MEMIVLDALGRVIFSQELERFQGSLTKELDLLPPRPALFSGFWSGGNKEQNQECCWTGCGGKPHSSKRAFESSPITEKELGGEQQSVTSVTSFTSREGLPIEEDLTSIPDMSEMLQEQERNSQTHVEETTGVHACMLSKPLPSRHAVLDARSLARWNPLVSRGLHLDDPGRGRRG